MKISKILLPVILIAATALAWFSFISNTIGVNAQYDACIKNAEESVEKGLYEQAVEYYVASLEYKFTEETYYSIMETYELYYDEEPTAYVLGVFSSAMEDACNAFPDNVDFWEKHIRLYMDNERYDDAYSVVEGARKAGVENDYINETYTTLIYMVETDYKLYTDFVTSLNGYITVSDGNSYYVINNVGTQVRSQYVFAGPLNENGKGMYVNSIDARILDAYEIARARFDIKLEDAGYYNDDLDLVPVKIDGKWKYMNSEGELLPGKYDVAAGFFNNTTVAYDGSAWYSVDSKGEASKLDGIEDIKLDLDGCFGRNDVIVARSEGKYHLYNTSFEKLCDFSADNMDLAIGSNLIAFESDGKWGYVDSEGNVKCEPKFAGAKSFSNNYAAVCDEDGNWGFINSEFEVVIGYRYADAYYFTDSETCPVSLTEGTMQLMSFVFEV